MKRIFVAASAAFGLVGSIGHAGAETLTDILTEENSGRLCAPDADGRSTVDRLAFGTELLNAIGYPFLLLDRANPAGRSNRGVSEDEVFYALTNDEPYGPNTSGYSAEDLQKIKGGISGLKTSFSTLLEKADHPPKGYRIERPADYQDALAEYFTRGSRITIVCSVGTDPGPKPKPTVLQKVVDKFRFVGNVDHLKRDDDESGVKLEDADAAKLSYRRDQVAHSDTFNVNFVTGYEFRDDDHGLSIIPYIQYQDEETGKRHAPDEKVESLSGGLMVDGYAKVSKALNFEYRLYPTFNVDLQQDAESVKLDAALAPTFDTPLGTIGLWTPSLGGFSFWQEIQILAEGGHVFDHGTSEDFTDGDEYFGIGGEVTLRVRYDDWAPLKQLYAYATYRRLQLFDSQLDHIGRLSAGVVYSFPEVENVQLRFDYVDGQNSVTSQDEHYWETAIGLKF